VSVVQQQPALFAGTIAQNVAYGMDHVDEAVVLDALARAGALEFVEREPEGIRTMVGERGARLSGGQLQRIAIARALVRDPRILLLDEATSALDVSSERVVQDALDVLRGTCTTLVVAHRLSTVRTADRIVVLRAGRVVEQGSHEELVAAGGAYAQMVRLQRD
jgi:ATP-binding cassette subfamily B protein